ncbi:MAG: hypothetical protein AAFR87_25180 [Bacteroidota bacterium]
MKATRKNYLVEGLLIVFSVLFALFINKLYEDNKIQHKKEIALESIQKELYQNQNIIKHWKEKHVAIRDRISDLIEGRNDSLKLEMARFSYLNLGLLTNNESLVDAILTKTAWESSKSTGILAEFDFETTQKLTHVYSLQEVLMERTLSKILDYYFDTQSHNMTQLDKILIQFQLRFWELTGQEVLLEQMYEQAIEEVKKSL